MGYGSTVYGCPRCFVNSEQHPLGPDIEFVVFPYIDKLMILEDGEFEDILSSAGGAGCDSIDAGGI